MPDDPHDAWVPRYRKVVWCPVHMEDAETCPCGRAFPEEYRLLIAVLICAAISVGIMVIIALLYFT